MFWNRRTYEGRFFRETSVNVSKESNSERTDGRRDVGSAFESVLSREEVCGESSTSDDDHENSLLAEEGLTIPQRQHEQECGNRQEVYRETEWRSVKFDAIWGGRRTYTTKQGLYPCTKEGLHFESPNKCNRRNLESFRSSWFEHRFHFQSTDRIYEGTVESVEFMPMTMRNRLTRGIASTESSKLVEHFPK